MRILHILFILLVPSLFYAQGRKPQNDQFNFVPGKFIVKLKDNVKTKISFNSQGKGTANINIGNLLEIKSKIKKTNILFSEKTINRSIQLKKNAQYSYKIKNLKTLKNIFLIELDDDKEDILSLIEELKQNDKVEYAEPNYNFSINDFEINSDIIYDKDIRLSSASNSN